MERLEKHSPSVELTEKQKEELAEVDRRYEAKIAERRVFLEGEIRKAVGTSEEDPLRRQLASEITRLQEELEEKKEAIRALRA